VPPAIIVSNRGPLAFAVGDDGNLTSRRGAGGLVSGLAPVAESSGAIWIASAMSDADRSAARSGLVADHGLNVRLVESDPADYRAAYDVIGNATLWFLHHGLFDTSRRPIFDRPWREAWKSWRRVTDDVATVVADTAPDGASVLLQDYHLALLGPALRTHRPDLRLTHFSHTPFAGPDLMGVLPQDAAAELLEAMASTGACGFHTARWARSFEASCQDVLGRRPDTYVAPLAPDPDDIAGVASSEGCDTELRALDMALGERKLIARVDRIELSKNLVRGFKAFDLLLDEHPQWRDKVVFGAFVYASREGLPEYLAYRQEVETEVARINRRWSTGSWTPIHLDLDDHFARSVAALRRYDALMVNPVRDGLNLVAMEGPLVNERDGVVLLSRQAGAFDHIGSHVEPIDPFDVAGTADALHRALSLDPATRQKRSAALHADVATRTPQDWFNDLLAHVS
jgi:trehalose 6-phosphate synthase